MTDTPHQAEEAIRRALEAGPTHDRWELITRLGVAGPIVGGVTRQYARGVGQDQLFTVNCVAPDNGGESAMIANAKLIVACQPTNIRALLTELDRLRSAKDADARDAAIWRWFRVEHPVTLIVKFFGNGSVNKTIEDVDAAIDSAMAQARKEGGNG